MKGYDRLEQVEKIIKAYKDRHCPYCFGQLEDFYRREVIKYGCRECKSSVEDVDYIKAIELVVKF